MFNETFSVIFKHRASKKLLLKHIQLNFSDDLRPNVPGVTNRSAPLIWFVKLYITFFMWIASNASFVNDNWPLEINCSLSTRILWFAKKTTMLHLQVWHTVRKSQIVSKNCEFEFLCQKSINYCDYDTPEIVKISYCRFCTCTKSRFWRENSNYPVNSCIKKSPKSLIFRPKTEF